MSNFLQNCKQKTTFATQGRTRCGEWLAFYVSNGTRNCRLRNDLYCVEWGVKLYSLTHSPPNYFNLLLPV